jgi:magnesium transporter
VDDSDKLIAVAALHALLFCEVETRIIDIADADFPRAHAGQDQEEVTRIFEKYDVLALPVVDENGVGGSYF